MKRNFCLYKKLIPAFITALLLTPQIALAAQKEVNITKLFLDHRSFKEATPARSAGFTGFQGGLGGLEQKGGKSRWGQIKVQFDANKRWTDEVFLQLQNSVKEQKGNNADWYSKLYQCTQRSKTKCNSIHTSAYAESLWCCKKNTGRSSF